MISQPTKVRRIINQQGSSVGFFDGITYGVKAVGSLSENIPKKRMNVEMVGSGCGPCSLRVDREVLLI